VPGSFTQGFITVAIGPSGMNDLNNTFGLSVRGGNEPYNHTLVMHCNCVVNMSQGDTVGLFIESNNSWAILIKNCIFGGYLIQAL